MVGPDVLSRDSLPLSGKNVLVTGVSRRAGIGYAIACRAAAYGANVFCHHYVPHDDDQEWGRDDLDAVLAGVREHVMPGAQLADKHADLTVLIRPGNNRGREIGRRRLSHASEVPGRAQGPRRRSRSP